MAKNIKVTNERPSGLNVGFDVPGKGHMSRSKLVPSVEKGNHPGYHTRTSPSGTKFVASDPDKSKSNNLD